MLHKPNLDSPLGHLLAGQPALKSLSLVDFAIILSRAHGKTSSHSILSRVNTWEVLANIILSELRGSGGSVFDKWVPQEVVILD